MSECAGIGRSSSPSRSAPGAETFNTESLSLSCRKLVAMLSPTLVSRFGSARGLGALARAIKTAICIAFSGYSTQLSGGSPAGWKARAMGLPQRLPLSPHLNPIHLPNRRPYARQFSAACSGALPALSVPTAVLQMLACACENACAGHGAEVRCWILTGVTVSARRKRRRAEATSRRLGLESDLLAESSMFVAESDGCPSQFAFISQP